MSSSGRPSVIFINLDESKTRRTYMEKHLTSLGVPFEREPGIRLNPSTLASEGLAVLSPIFEDMKCGNWSCEKGDKICCWGFKDASEKSKHGAASRRDKHVSYGTSYLGNLAAHIRAFKRIGDEFSRGRTERVVVTEDDVKFDTGWDERLEKILPLAGDWDVIRLYSTTPSRPIVGNCYRKCVDVAGVEQCILKTGVGKSCLFLSTAALMVRPERVKKIITALQMMSLRMSKRAIVDQDRTLKISARYSIDHLLWRCHHAGLLKVKATWPPVVNIDRDLDGESTFVA